MLNVAVNVVRHLSSVLLAIAVVLANVGTCAGWAATPEARMSCCKKGGGCAMRGGSSKSANGANAAKGANGAKDSRHALTQAQADSCCAASEREESDSSNAAAVVVISNAVLGDGVILPASVPALVLSERWRAVAPLPSPPVARHLLLSVFLV